MKPEWKELSNWDNHDHACEIEHSDMRILLAKRKADRGNKRWVVISGAVNLNTGMPAGSPVIHNCETVEEARIAAVKLVRERLANLLRAANELPA